MADFRLRMVARRRIPAGDAVRRLLSGEISLGEASGLTQEDLDEIRRSALTYLTEGHTETAATLVRLCLCLGDVHPITLLLAAQILKDQGQDAEALRVMDDVLTQLGDDPRGRPLRDAI